MANYDFDLDLVVGEEAEDLVAWLRIELAKRTIEVKRDIYVAKSGNVAIEYKSRGKPSGIAVSIAAWWAIVLDGPGYEMEQIVFIRLERLKRKCRKYFGAKGRDKPGGDNGTSRMILLPVSELVTKEICGGKEVQSENDNDPLGLL